jgi:hypothetical protein
MVLKVSDFFLIGTYRGDSACIPDQFKRSLHRIRLLIGMLTAFSGRWSQASRDIKYKRDKKRTTILLQLR